MSESKHIENANSRRRTTRKVNNMPKYKVTMYYENTQVFEAENLEDLEDVIEKKSIGSVFSEIKEEREIKVIRKKKN